MYENKLKGAVKMIKWFARLFKKETPEEIYIRKINSIAQLCDELALKVRK